MSQATDVIAPTPSEGSAIRVAGVLRDIAVGGLAAIIVGIVVGGIGGRLIMRLAALLVPDSVGRLTENGNRIGAITTEGSLALLVFGGILAGVVAGGVWVVVRPWLPSARRDRLLASIPVAIAFGTPLLIEADNPDFGILRHDPVVVGSLVLLVAITGPAVVLVDGWLDRRLPAAVAGRRLSVAVYGVVAVVGLFFTVALTIPVLTQVGSPLVTFAIVCVGLTTLLMWAGRVGGEDRPTPGLAMLGRGVLVVAVAVGLATAMLDIVGALGLT